MAARPVGRSRGPSRPRERSQPSPSPSRSRRARPPGIADAERDAVPAPAGRVGEPHLAAPPSPRPRRGAVLGEGARRQARAVEVEAHVDGARRVELEVEDEEPLLDPRNRLSPNAFAGERPPVEAPGGTEPAVGERRARERLPLRPREEPGVRGEEAAQDDADDEGAGARREGRRGKEGTKEPRASPAGPPAPASGAAPRTSRRPRSPEAGRAAPPVRASPRRAAGSRTGRRGRGREASRSFRRAESAAEFTPSISPWIRSSCSGRLIGLPRRRGSRRASGGPCRAATSRSSPGSRARRSSRRTRAPRSAAGPRPRGSRPAGP